jgi:hypothetical protein
MTASSTEDGPAPVADRFVGAFRVGADTAELHFEVGGVVRPLRMPTSALLEMLATLLWQLAPERPPGKAPEWPMARVVGAKTDDGGASIGFSDPLPVRIRLTPRLAQGLAVWFATYFPDAVPPTVTPQAN